MTWATSLVAGLALTVWIGASALGAVGGVVGNLAGDALSGTDITQIAEEVDTDELTDEQTTREATHVAQASAWWSFAGLLLGAGIATLGGVLGARTVISRTPEVDATTR